ncbi:MAG: hypothetical protein ACFB03_18665 [Paracoccaceae bacterium]
MEPFIAELAFNTETETSSDALLIFTSDPAEINGGLDRDIIRRVAKDHALEDAPEDQDVAAPDQFVFDKDVFLGGTDAELANSEDDGEAMGILTELLLPALDGDQEPLHGTGDDDFVLGGGSTDIARDQVPEHDPELDLLAWSIG